MTTETNIRVLMEPRDRLDFRSDRDLAAIKAIKVAWKRHESFIRREVEVSRRPVMAPHLTELTPRPFPGTEYEECSASFENIAFRMEKFGFYNLRFMAIIGRYDDADFAVHWEKYTG